MREVNNGNFGLLIAYLIPGGVALAGFSLPFPTIGHWLGASAATSPTVSGFLFATLASVGLGVFVNLLRHLTIDTIHVRTGIGRGQWDYSVLQQNITAIEFLVQNQFRYHQFYGNLLIALAIDYALALAAHGQTPVAVAVSFGLVEIVLFFGSRICFRIYCQRLEEILQVEKQAAGPPLLWISPSVAHR